MPLDATDQRVHTRAQYFLLRSNDGQAPLPVYALRASGDVDAIPALVVDMSEGGVQILSTQSASLASGEYLLEISQGDGAELVAQKVAMVWSRPDGVNVRSGFAFADQAAPVAQLELMLKAADHGLLRCLLRPCQTV